jgi:glycosyltransferase involved in cell wall biosynthesis
MNIWLISIFEQTPLDNSYSWRFMGIAETAAKNGHKVTFIASTFRHTSKKQRYLKTTRVNVAENYDMLYVKSLGYKKNVSFKRLYSHYEYSKRLVKEIEKIETKPDVILLAYPPMSIASEITKWAKQKKIPTVIDIIDPWPDILNKNRKGVFGMVPAFAVAPLKNKVTRIFTDVTAISAISKKYVEWGTSYCSKHKNCKWFYPAVDLTAIQNDIAAVATTEKTNPDEFRLVYAGSLAVSYDIKTILRAAEILYPTYGNKIKLIIAGKGIQDIDIKEYLTKYDNVAYLGWLAKEQLLKEYFKADVGLAQYTIGSTQTVTYKLFDLLSFNLPILNSLVGEMNDIILDNKVGLFNEPGNAQQLADNIELLYKDRNLLTALTNNCAPVTAKLGDSKVVYKNMIDYLGEVADNFKK